MDVGLEAAGFETLACIELDPWARETLQINRPEWLLCGAGDVHEAALKLTPRSRAGSGLELSDSSLEVGNALFHGQRRSTLALLHLPEHGQDGGRVPPVVRVAA
ncbi:hypothetical protein [Clavibacter tessellarius]|uniref:hypothetical protein n=1 Tax=Clavibacter tessellarius TaxID=31965 RepID=UPI0039EC96F3